MDITQKELADDLGMGSTTITEWEKGRNYPNIEMFQKIADYFKVTPNYLLGYDDTAQGGEQTDREQRAFAEFRALDMPEQLQAIGYMSALREIKNKKTF